MNYIDLGLPSGTLWAESNEEGHYEFDEAVNKYRNSIPTFEHLTELKNQCRWEWNGGGYNVTGPNGNSIVLPADGYRYSDDVVDYVGTYGCYWSSTPYDSDNSLYISIRPGGVGLFVGDRCYGKSVRLIKER